MPNILNIHQCKTGLDFENWVVEFLREYGFDAYRVKKNDGGVDVIAKIYIGDMKHNFCIQCKYVNSALGKRPIQAVEAHKAYVLDVIDTLEKLNIEQWVTTDTGSSHAWDTGSAIGPNLNLRDAGHSSQTGSTEEKYYLRGDGEQGNGAGEGDIDVYPNPSRNPSETIGVDTKYYTFFVNTFGEIRYIEGNTSPNIGSETMGNPVGDTTSTLINNRTHIIDKLEAALEHGTGDDGRGRSKTGRRWYNEACKIF